MDPKLTWAKSTFLLFLSPSVQKMNTIVFVLRIFIMSWNILKHLLYSSTFPSTKGCPPKGNAQRAAWLAARSARLWPIPYGLLKREEKKDRKATALAHSLLDTDGHRLVPRTKQNINTMYSLLIKRRSDPSPTGVLHRPISAPCRRAGVSSGCSCMCTCACSGATCLCWNHLSWPCSSDCTPLIPLWL